MTRSLEESVGRQTLATDSLAGARFCEVAWLALLPGGRHQLLRYPRGQTGWVNRESA